MAFVIAFIFSMFGQGGGSVFSPMLVLLGFTVLISTSTSLVLNLITSVSAGYIFYRKGMIDLRVSLTFVPGICLGAFIGGATTALVDTTLILWLFVFFLAALGTRMAYTYWEADRAEEKPPDRLSSSMLALIVLFSFATGFISGLLGVGGGVLIVPFMVYICRYPTKFAAGASHLIISFSALFGIMGHSAYHDLDMPLIATTGIAVLIAGNLGARTSMRLTGKGMRSGLGLILWALALMLVLKLMGWSV